MSKRLSKCIACFYYFVKSLIVLSVTAAIISIASFVTVIESPAGIVSASFSLGFSISTGVVKKLLKSTRNKKKKHNQFVMLARSKLNCIEFKTSEALINNEISQLDFEAIFNEERNYRELKEAIIKMMNSQRSDTEEINLIEQGKRIGIDNIIKRNTIINNTLKSKT